MRFYRHFMYGVFLAILLWSCNADENKSSSGKSSGYDLLHPFVLKLPEALAEISGIAYYPKDTSVFAIEDENGIFYKISLNTGNVKKWRFDKKHDYEDVVLKDSIFYVLISNGDIEILEFEKGENINTSKFDFPNAGKKTNEFESVFYDDSLKKLVLICKDCDDDTKKTVSGWGFDIDTRTFIPSVLNINVAPISAEMGLKKMKFKPSAAAINPVTNELYILSSVNHLLVVTDRKGNFKDAYALDPAIYKQPEGLAFTPAGDMIISNESHETGLANILILKNKKKGL